MAIPAIERKAPMSLANTEVAKATIISNLYAMYALKLSFSVR